MIDYLNGIVAELTPTYVVVDCNGVGYEVNITLLDYSKIDTSQRNKIYIYEVIREDSHNLFGFLDKRDRELFKLLIGVSGVGPNTARLIMSSLRADTLESSIVAGDPNPFKAVKGVGVKTAQRIIVDLKDKIKTDVTTLNNQLPVNAGETYDDALAALTMLGFAPQQSQKALKKLFSGNPALSTEQAIKEALKML